MDARFRRVSLAGLALALVLVAALAASQLAAASPTNASAGTRIYCTDATYPPEEFFQGGKIVGSDIDIGTEVGKRLGETWKPKNTTFDSIIPALLTKKCDAIISGMNDTAERRKSVDFVDYFKVGQSLLVKKGNPKHVTGLASLSGLRVSVESGTTNRDFLDAQSRKLVKQGKKPITIVTFPKDTASIAALKAGRVDAYFADAPPVAYYAKRDTSVEIAGHPISPIPIGIALRKGDPLKAGVQKAINGMYADGTMRKIAARWGMTDSVVFLKK